MKFEYKGFYKKYDMNGTLKIGGGTLKVHDIFDPTPEFMKKADCIFVDFPGGQSPLNSYYTKAEIEYRTTFESFINRAFEVIREINPDNLFVEVFKVNKQMCIDKVSELYPFVKVYPSTYYHDENKKCWIIQGSRNDKTYPLADLDEEDVVPKICECVDFKVIGDICMGQGLVGRSAYNIGKEFVGTELNYKRLGVLVDYLVKRGAVLEHED